jgi:hypothetical protein
MTSEIPAFIPQRQAAAGAAPLKNIVFCCAEVHYFRGTMPARRTYYMLW